MNRFSAVAGDEQRSVMTGAVVAARPDGPTVRTVALGFVVTYDGPISRLWHDACRNHENLPDLTDATIVRLVAGHVCGPRTSAWSSPGGAP